MADESRAQHTGLFITFEGGEGAGKTSQIKRLSVALIDQGHDVVVTREPGGTAEAEKIRDLLVRRDGGEYLPITEALLMIAARAEHVAAVITPALAQGKIVLCDRFSDSTLAYQGFGHGLALEKIKAISRQAIGDISPDVTFILDIDVREGLSRSYQALDAARGAITEDRFERMDISFHTALRQGFLDIAKAEPSRCHVIDAAASMDHVAQAIRGVVNDRIAERGGRA